MIMVNYGDAGVFIAMFLESSIVPIPSEAIIIGAGSLGIPMMSVVIFGSLGAVCGACVGYAIGRYAARGLIYKYGKYILIKREYIEKAERFALKYGAMSVLIGRLVPIIPFKVFSISAGIVRLPFLSFVVYTFIGVVPRMVLLVWYGKILVEYTKPAVAATVAAVAIFFLVRYFIKKRRPA